MSTIRRQSIISSGIVYFGFALGFVNTYLFTREGSGFTGAEYGLTGAFISFANIMSTFSLMGMNSYIYKFFPYYKDNLEPSENDMMTWALISSLVGFVMVMTGAWIFKDLVIRKFGTNSPEFLKYYKWVFPFAFGLTLFSLLEAFAWQLKKSVLTNYLREVQFRLFTTVLIILFYWGVIRDFDLFIKVYAITYIAVALILFSILFFKKDLNFTFSISRVTRKFYKKILTLISLIWGGNLVFTVSNVFDSIVILAVMPDGLAYVGIYTLAQNIASLIQAPQRGIISASLASLSQAWKDKDMKRVDRIYHRSSINQIIFSTAMFCLIWLNFTDGVFTFHLQKEYLAAKDVFLFIGLMRIIDMGTGVNSQIIGTSTFWRFDFISGIILLAITLPFNYLLTKHMGVIGPSIANLVALTIYNAIRYLFLLKKFNMQPFNWKSLLTIVVAIVAYFVSYWSFNTQTGFIWMVLRSSLFLAIFIPATLLLKLSPDIIPVWNTILKKVGIRNK